MIGHTVEAPGHTVKATAGWPLSSRRRHHGRQVRPARQLLTPNALRRVVRLKTLAECWVVAAVQPRRSAGLSPLLVAERSPERPRRARTVSISMRKFSRLSDAHCSSRAWNEEE